MSERLQLKKDEPAREEITCPGCGKPMGVGAVICVQCGYDTRTGRRIDASGGRKVSPVLIIGLVLAVVAAGAMIYLRSLDDGVRPTPLPDPVSVAPEPSAQDAAPAPAEAAAPVEPAEAVASATDQEQTPVTETNEVEQPPQPEIDWEEVAARQRERIAVELDRRTPMFEQGESVELRQNNGLIRRGVFRGVINAEVQLEAGENDLRGVPFDQLDRHTRLRVDDEYRARYVDYLTRQRIAELKRAQSAQP